MKNNKKFRENSDPEPDLEVGFGSGSGQKSSGSATLVRVGRYHDNFAYIK